MPHCSANWGYYEHLCPNNMVILIGDPRLVDKRTSLKLGEGEQMAKWTDTRKRFVAFFDVMGFKDFVYRHNHAKVVSLMRKLETGIRKIKRTEESLLFKRGRPATPKNDFDIDKVVVRPVFFSDSILLVTSDASPASANKMLMVAAWLTCHCMARSIPVKGAIALGEMTADFVNSVHCGRPLIDAYLLQDDLLIYGVVLHHTAEKFVRSHRVVGLNEEIVLQNVPMKSCVVHHAVLDWTRHLGGREDPMKMIRKFYSTVSGVARRYVDNTLVYTQQALEKQAKNKKKT